MKVLLNDHWSFLIDTTRDDDLKASQIQSKKWTARAMIVYGELVVMEESTFLDTSWYYFNGWKLLHLKIAIND